MEREPDIAPELVDLLYGELAGEERAAAEAKVAADPELAGELERLRRVRATARMWAEATEAEPARGVDDLLAAARAQAPRKAAAARAEVKEESVGLWARFQRWMQPLVASPALSAALTLVLVGGAATAFYLTRGKLEVAEPMAPAPAGARSTPPAPPAEPTMAEPTPPPPAAVTAPEPAGEETKEAAAEGAVQRRAPSKAGRPVADDGFGAPPAPARPAKKPASRAPAPRADEAPASADKAPAPPAPPAPPPAPAPAPAPAATPSEESAPAPAAPRPESTRRQVEQDASEADRRVEALKLTEQAREAADKGDCARVQAWGRRVRALDRAYYDQTFARDRRIAACLAKK